MSQLRERMLHVFEEMSEGNFDLDEGSIMSKISETIISGLKVELQYAHLTNAVPHIPFLENGNGEAIKISPNSKLLEKSR